MASFVFDANIPIAFKKTGHFNILESLFSTDQYNHELIMGTSNLGECKRGLDVEIKQFKRFEEEKRVNATLLRQIKNYYDSIKRQDEEMHTRNDADFHFMMIVLITKPDFFVCNDRHLVQFFGKYRTKYGGGENVKCYTLAPFLDLIRRSFMKAFENEDLLFTNLNIYHNDELPSFFTNMKRAECFVERGHSEKYLRWSQQLFADYKDNVFRIYG